MEGLFIGMTGYEVGSKTNQQEVKVITVTVPPPPFQMNENPFNSQEIVLIISLTTGSIVVLLLLLKACKCAMQFMKAVDHSNDQNA